MLDIWPIAKARAEVWSMSSRASVKSINSLKAIAKDKFNKLALIYHPDKQTGNEERYINIRAAYEIIRDSESKDLVNALKDEHEDAKELHMPGSLKCRDCVKWGDIVGLCITVSCTGFKSLKSENIFIKNKFRKNRRKAIRHCDV